MVNTAPTQRSPHLPVLYHEIITALRPVSPGKYVDCTVGAGGHANGILLASSPGGQLLGLDVDPQALSLASEKLAEFSDRVHLAQASYTTLQHQLTLLGWNKVQGILIDLGVSSMQLDTPTRGFSFLTDGPLDMRLDPLLTLSAADIINGFSEEDLANILWRFGEERLSRRIAKAIVSNRPLQSTAQLAGLIQKTIGRKPGQIHPATRSFQALRIAVNQELNALETVLPQAVEALGIGGVLAVISFHSLEDRIVKHFIRRESKDCICPVEQPVCTCNHKAVLKDLTKKPLEPQQAEIEKNPRSRSARLRIAEKI